MKSPRHTSLGARLALFTSTIAAFAALGCAGAGDHTTSITRPAPSASASATATAQASAPSPIEVSIIGTNDLHGRVGSLPILGGYMSALRAARPGRVVLIDAGDMFQGTIESNLEEGAPVIAAYRALGYAAAAIGNHEFDYGPVGEATVVRKRPASGAETAGGGAAGADDPRGALKARAAQAEGAFPLLSANLLEDGRPLAWPNVKPRTLVKLPSGVTVGVVGVTTTGTPKTTIAANVVGVTVAPLAEAITREAAALRAEGADIVVAAAHAGGECKDTSAPDDLSSCIDRSEIFDVARELPKGAVDVIVAGHTHKTVAHRVAGVPIIESMSNGAGFGRVDVTWDPAARRVIGVKIHPPTSLTTGATYEGRAVEPSPEIAEVLRPAIERGKARRSESLRVTLDDVFATKYREESALGNLMTTLMLELDPAADVAITNAGGLRVDLPAGPLSYGALYESIPFDNKLARVTMTAASLAEVMKTNLLGARGLFSMAGARVRAACGPGGPGDLEVTLELEPRAGRGAAAKGKAKVLRASDRVVVATSDFLATGGDDFGKTLSVEIDEGAPPYRDLLAELLKKRGGTLRSAEWLLPSSPRIQVLGARRDNEGRFVCDKK